MQKRVENLSQRENLLPLILRGKEVWNKWEHMFIIGPRVMED